MDQALTDLAAARLRGAVLRVGLAVAALAVLACALLAAIGFLIAAFYLHLATRMDPAAAALLTGVTVLVIAGAGVAVAWPRRSAAPVAAPAPVDPARAAGAGLARWVSDKPLEASAAALAIGFVLGVSPGARRALRAASELVLPPR